MDIGHYLKLKDRNKAFKDLFRKTFGFKPGKINIYKMAFRHRSVDPKTENNNERLEFLGDAILSAVISELVYNSNPGSREGFLTQMRSKIVNRELMNKIALEMGIDQFIEYDKSIKSEGDFINDIFGNCLEALVGAVYIDKGYLFTRKFILNYIVRNYVDINELKTFEKNFKGRLFELAQRCRLEIRFITEESHQKNDIIYNVRVLVDGEEMGNGKSTRKKKAEQDAAKIAYERLVSDNA